MSENIYTYFAQFVRAAKQAHWSQERIDAVIKDAQSADYVHALTVLFEAIGEIEHGDLQSISM
jgi:hypothetical protein